MNDLRVITIGSIEQQQYGKKSKTMKNYLFDLSLIDC